jgi:hypothetical protein
MMDRFWDTAILSRILFDKNPFSSTFDHCDTKHSTTVSTMTFTPENRKTQIDFNTLELSSRPQTDLLDQAIQKPAGNDLSNRGNPIEDTAKTVTAKTSSPERGAGLKPPGLPKAVRSGIWAYEYWKTIDGSPWKSYMKILDIRLGEADIFVTVAKRKNAQYSSVQKDAFLDLALVRTLLKPRDEDKLCKF